jgi:hypothetical protein
VRAAADMRMISRSTDPSVMGRFIEEKRGEREPLTPNGLGFCVAGTGWWGTRRKRRGTGVLA